MCGLAGFIALDSYTNAEKTKVLERMTGLLEHRGPDAQGKWIEDNIALCHNRLSILDLSEHGAQPMKSLNDRYVIVFNGEIYNHLDLRKALDKNQSLIKWRGHSDTETILEYINEFGIEKSLEDFIGMFAFALYDRKEKKLTLARDRFGEKPLYYGFINNNFIFASELKAFKVFPGFDNRISNEGFEAYFKFGYVPAPHTIYDCVSKLNPASFISLEYENIKSRKVNENNYWVVSRLAKHGVNNQINDINEIKDEFNSLLKKSVKSQLISDVPIGCFLSGGIDSSLISSEMQNIVDTPIKTFTIGFEEPEFDESIFARKVAEHLGTDHHELIVDSNMSLDVIPSLVDMYDEPFSDSSAIPTFLVSKLAKENVKVSLSGDGGDELFGGYNRYLYTKQLWSKIDFLPFEIRKIIGNLISILPRSRVSRFISFLTGQKSSETIEKFFKAGKRLNTVKDIDDLYLSLVTDPYLNKKFFIQNNFAISGFPETLLSKEFMNSINITNSFDRMMLQDQISYLPDDILCKVDRAAMSNSLETRAPFLDKELAEFSWRIPSSYKIYKGNTKYVLRESLNRYIPSELINRPKKGFGIPLAEWIRGPLNEWTSDLLSKDRIQREGLFNYNEINSFVSEHQSRKFDWSSKIWSLLMFQSWLDRQ